MFYLGVVIFGTQSFISHLQPKAMANRTRDGVEERTKGQRLLLLYKGVLVRVLNLHALMNNFEHRVLRIEPINTVLVGVLDLHRDKKS